MTPQERSKWFFLTSLRGLLAFFDLAGVFLIGFVAMSTALFLTSGSDSRRVIQLAGLELPAVTAQTLPFVAAAVLALFLSKALASVLLTKKAAFFVAKVEARSARTIAEVCFSGDLASSSKRSREEVMFAIQGGSPSAFNVVLNSTNSLITEGMLFVVVCVGFLLVDAVATLAAVIYFAVIAFVIQYFVGSLMSKAGQTATVGAVASSTAINDLISVFRELLVAGKRETFIEKIYTSRVSTANSSATQFYLGGMPRYIIETALLLGVALFVLVQALSGDVVKSAATVGVFLSGGFRLTAALLPLQNALLTIKSAVPAASFAHEILALSADVAIKHTHVQEDAKSDIPRLNPEGPVGVAFDNVSFSYLDADTPALRGVSFEVPPGSQVALMGPSGAGKSTIADLACRVLTPTQGQINLISGVVSARGTLADTRIGYVPQRPGLVSGTILENIALGVDSLLVNREDVVNAISLANLGDVVSGLPDGADTPLGKLQDGLSGGQLQRLGLARALYNKPQLLIMDEATSALDAESEAEIQKALDSMRGKVTVVLIAHRLNTIQHADKVILVEGGQVKDSGTFKELLARNPAVERVVDLMRVEKD